MPLKVVHTFAESGMDYGEALLEPLGASAVRGHWASEDDLIANCKDANGIICAGPIQNWTPRVLAALTHCRIISTLSIGYDRIPVDAASEMGMVVTNIPDYCIDEVSSQAIAFMMALNRKLFPIDRAVRQEQVFIYPGNREALKKYPIYRLRGQTLGIIGFGKIGTAVALKARGLGLNVIAYDPYVLGAVMASHGVEPASLDRLLRESDFISINAALTAETKGMIGQEELARMKPTCYLINTARAHIVQEPALIDALQRNINAGAGLDVTVEEPIRSDNPLLGMPNTILTAHSAWFSTTSESPAEFWHKPMTQVVMALKGEWPTYAVNPEIKQVWLKKWGRTG